MIAALLRTVTLGAAMALPTIALAQGAAPPPPPPPGGGELAKVREACRADVERLCKGVEPGGGRIRECLRAHQSELSDGCKAAIAEAREHHHHPKG
jgi:hypothetical protein